MSDQPLDNLLARLERERLDADRRYNDALTAVDRAIQPPVPLPGAPPPADPSRLPEANDHWDILPSSPPDTSGTWRGRLRRFVWDLVTPTFERQRRFNAAILDHLNRHAAREQALQSAVATLLDVEGREHGARARFESLLVQYLQTITAYVDTKDRSLAGTDLRERLALTDQRVRSLKRDVERLLQGAPAAPADHERRLHDSGSAEPFAGSVDSLTYVGFEDRFRGAQDEIGRRVEEYVPLFSSAADVVDIGCGRGELLQLLRDRGVSARGVDGNRAMVDVCRARGLEAEHADALAYLEGRPDGSIGGLAAIQVVEHFEPGYLLRFLEAASHRMRPGAPLALETINPACWMAFFETYLRDLTHKQPLHPDTLCYIVQAAGFTDVDVRFRRPVGEADRLPVIPTAGPLAPELAAVVAALNAHAERLNARLFSSMDYAVVARR